MLKVNISPANISTTCISQQIALGNDPLEIKSLSKFLRVILDKQNYNLLSI